MTIRDFTVSLLSIPLFAGGCISTKQSRPLLSVAEYEKMAMTVLYTTMIMLKARC